jgi:NAD(P)-dependent dehydrogenase (short-subunit alcohol dehydrogenase family)
MNAALGCGGDSAIDSRNGRTRRDREAACQVDDIVPLVQFLASPGSQWLKAQMIFINGGYAAR